MSHVELKNLSRSYGQIPVVNGISAEVSTGEFVAFLGPSGCGKTTTLRMIAGLDEPSDGEIRIGGELVSAPRERIFVPPERRKLGMVFQSYALWPHMTVTQNVAYPLVVRGVPSDQALRKAGECLELVQLTGLGQRYPHELSGGQQQRVALARALVMEPAVLLLDEPLSNLDAHLREQMRFEIKDLQQRLAITVVFVTHDQAEAFAMSDRIMVMRQGEIVQVGAPEEIYRRPANPFVAAFLGVANVAEGRVVQPGRVLLDGTDVPIQADSTAVDRAVQVIV
ncbi:MAG: ABC transporter ATP-binding protein, partial [Candidatus Riflebacteria bacterium]|nr:ABC transporter ATP-binding protein [Candidatus Riflebacteria bacterium]